jgi:Protein of unknown function (DUF1573)
VSVLALAALLAVLDGGAAAPPPRAVLEPPGFDFGRLRPGRRVEKDLVLRNNGGRDLDVLAVSTTCGCTVVSGYAKSVPPGGRTVLRVAFTAPAQAGRTVKSVLVKTNDPERPAVEVKLAAEVVAEKPAGK